MDPAPFPALCDDDETSPYADPGSGAESYALSSAEDEHDGNAFILNPQPAEQHLRRNFSRLSLCIGLDPRLTRPDRSDMDSDSDSDSDGEGDHDHDSDDTSPGANMQEVQLCFHDTWRPSTHPVSLHFQSRPGNQNMVVRTRRPPSVEPTAPNYACDCGDIYLNPRNIPPAPAPPDPPAPPPTPPLPGLKRLVKRVAAIFFFGSVILSLIFHCSPFSCQPTNKCPSCTLEVDTPIPLHQSLIDIATLHATIAQRALLSQPGQDPGPWSPATLLTDLMSLAYMLLVDVNSVRLLLPSLGRAQYWETWETYDPAVTYLHQARVLWLEQKHLLASHLTVTAASWLVLASHALDCLEPQETECRTMTANATTESTPLKNNFDRQCRDELERSILERVFIDRLLPDSTLPSTPKQAFHGVGLALAPLAGNLTLARAQLDQLIRLADCPDPDPESPGASHQSPPSPPPGRRWWWSSSKPHPTTPSDLLCARIAKHITPRLAALDNLADSITQARDVAAAVEARVDRLRCNVTSLIVGPAPLDYAAKTGVGHPMWGPLAGALFGEREREERREDSLSAPPGEEEDVWIEVDRPDGEAPERRWVLAKPAGGEPTGLKDLVRVVETVRPADNAAWFGDYVIVRDESEGVTCGRVRYRLPGIAEMKEAIDVAIDDIYRQSRTTAEEWERRDAAWEPPWVRSDAEWWTIWKDTKSESEGGNERQDRSGKSPKQQQGD